MINKGHKNNSYEEKHSQPAAKTLEFTSSYNHVTESYKERSRSAFTKLQLYQNILEVSDVSQKFPRLLKLSGVPVTPTIQHTRNTVSIILRKLDQSSIKRIFKTAAGL